jgi:hypothetical protein
MTLRRTQPLAAGHLINPMAIVSFIILHNHVFFLSKVAVHCEMSPLRTKPGAL